MYQSIRERIDVAGVYKNSKFLPRKFRWQAREYQISEVTLTADTKDGGVQKRHFSVMSEGNVYRLCFNRDNESWTLEEVWVD